MSDGRIMARMEKYYLGRIEGDLKLITNSIDFCNLAMDDFGGLSLQEISWYMAKRC